MNTVNHFATTDECRDSIGKWKIDSAWWSRRYEYPWAAQYMGKMHSVLDAGCGITHPFKYWLADNCKEVTAVDNDPRIATLAPYAPNLVYVKSNLCSLPFPEGKFDRIVCISTLEHIPHAAERIEVLREFSRVLAGGGLIIITIDVPTIPVITYLSEVSKAGLQLVGDCNTEIPNNVLREKGRKKRMVFCSILHK